MIFVSYQKHKVPPLYILAIIPPINDKNIGNRNQKLLLGLSGYIYFVIKVDNKMCSYVALALFFCTCVISISIVSRGSST